MLRFNKEFVLVGFDAEDSDAVIQALARRLHDAGLVEAEYGAATIERERHHATGLPTRPFPIAFPHADADGVIESALAVATLKRPVGFRNMADPEEELPVELVIMLAELRSLTTDEDIAEWLTEELNLNQKE